jgi:hypothetical protein
MGQGTRVEQEAPGGPAVRVEPLAPRARATPGRWRVGWRITNASPRPLRLLAAWCPHGRFRAPEWVLEPAPTLAPGQTAVIETDVACAEAPGTVVENAFVILRALWGDEPWRILARLEVRVGPGGVPEHVVVLITRHRIGFSRAGP